MSLRLLAGVVSTALVGLGVALAGHPGPEQGCLYANVESGKVLAPPCADADPLNLADDPRIVRAMNALGIPRGKVRFKGCDELFFSTNNNPDPANHAQQYLVTYRSNAGEDYLAPAIHELAHVFQLEGEGGSMASLWKRRGYESLKIELEADYLAGLIFRQALDGESVSAFKQNLILVGMYREDSAKAHGTPAQRTSAFNLGYYLKMSEDIPDLTVAARHFQANEYGTLARSR